MKSINNFINESVNSALLKIIVDNLKDPSADFVKDINAVLPDPEDDDTIIAEFDDLKDILGTTPKDAPNWVVTDRHYNGMKDYWDACIKWATPIAKKWRTDVFITAAIGYVVNGL